MLPADPRVVGEDIVRVVLVGHDPMRGAVAIHAMGADEYDRHPATIKCGDEMLKV